MATTYTMGPAGGDPVYTEVGPNIVACKLTMTTALVLNDVIILGPIPPGALLTVMRVDEPQLDTGTSLTQDVGTDLSVANQGVDTAGFIALSTVGRSSTLNLLNFSDPLYVHGSIPFLYSPKASAITTGVLPVTCNLQIKIHTAAQTAANTTGTIYAYYEYTMVNNSLATSGHAFL